MDDLKVDFYLLVFAGMNLFFYILLISKLIVQTILFETRVNKNIRNILLLIGFGIIHDSYRIFSIYFLGFVNRNMDIAFFSVKTACLFVSYIISFHLVAVLNEQSGHKIKQRRVIEFLYMGIVFVLSLRNIYTFITPIYLGDTPITLPNVFYSIHMDNLTIICMVLLFSPLAILILIKSRTFLKEVKTGEIYWRYILVNVLMALLFIERFTGLSSFFLTTSSYYFEYISLTFILAITSLIIYKYPDYLESISTYFCVKSIYIVKNNGNMIYEYDFSLAHDLQKVPISSSQLLLGGFIFALTSGLRDVLKLGGRVESINFGKMHLIFKHSETIFGILFCIENTPMVYQKLSQFINRFEGRYREQLTHWKGEMAFLDKEELEKWVIDIFR